MECLFHVYHYEGASSHKRRDCDVYGIAKGLPKFNLTKKNGIKLAAAGLWCLYISY